MDSASQFIVDFSLPVIMPQRFIDLIPNQRDMVNKYFVEGKLANYILSIENQKLWAVFNAKSEREVLDMVAKFPLTKYMEFKVMALTFNQSMSMALPAFSLN